MNPRDIFDYNKETGELLWKCRPKKFYKESLVAGCINALGYVQISYQKKQYLAHRVIWELVFGEPPVGWIDHVDGNRSNNRIENLRVVTPRQNSWNRKANRDTSSKFKGVYYYKNYDKWHARYSSTHIGYFDTEEQAAKAYDDFVSKFQGSFALPNFKKEPLTDEPT